MVELAGLDLVKRNDDSFEEVDVFFPQRNGKSTDNTCKNIQKLSSSVELVILVNKCVEAISHGFSNHFSSWNKLGIKSVEDILEIFSFSRFFGIEKLQKLLNESMSYIHFQ